jgi:hypothetical protein
MDRHSFPSERTKVEMQSVSQDGTKDESQGSHPNPNGKKPFHVKKILSLKLGLENQRPHEFPCIYFFSTLERKYPRCSAPHDMRVKRSINPVQC